MTTKTEIAQTGADLIENSPAESILRKSTDSESTDVTNTVHGGTDVQDSVPAAGDSATLTQLIAMLRQREAGGLKEYGQTVDRTDFTHVDWLREALHESMDKSLYLLRAIETAPRWRPIATAPKDTRIICAWFGSKEFTESSPAMFHTPINAWCNVEDIRDLYGIPDLWMPWPSDPPHPGEGYIAAKFPGGIMTVTGEDIPHG